jgi:hypothetical protein
MSGRAGRRGLDENGICIMVIIVFLFGFQPLLRCWTTWSSRAIKRGKLCRRFRILSSLGSRD